jgi:hypothetical protein
MKCVATGDGAVALSAVDVAAIEACHHIVLHRPAPLDVASLPAITPAEVAGLVDGSAPPAEVLGRLGAWCRDDR